MLNKELEEKLILSLDKIGNWVENIEDFVLEQAPLVIQEMMTFHYYSYVTGFIISLSLFGLGLIAGYYLIYKINYNSNDDMGKFTLSLITLLSGVLSIPVVIINGYNLLYITLAPKLYVLEQLKNLL